MQSFQEQEFFCEECGAANPGAATLCVACKEPLTRSLASLPAPAPVKPVVVAPPVTLQVSAGAALATSAYSAVSADALKPGTLLQNRYRIECEIGRGGYSIVYKAWDNQYHGRPVSIKQINLRNLTPRQVIEATGTFNRETTLLPILKHEGIPKFYGHFTDPEHWYLVMEYIPGRTLEDYLQKVTTGGYCSLTETLKIGVALSSILEYLHIQRQPVIFRDVKPANIMLTPLKKLYLIDFGIARSFNPGKMKDTTPLGSPGFAAPEQYGRAQSDPRTDIYGLGATLQTLLTGRDPLELRAGEPSRSPHPIPLQLQKLLDSMMESDASRRPPNMAVVRQGLQRALAKTSRFLNYCLGLVLGIVYFLWGYLTFNSTSLSPSFFSTFSLFLLSLCLWGLIGVVGVVVLLIFLAIPSKRYTSFGVLTVVLCLFLLSMVQIHLWPF